MDIYMVNFNAEPALSLLIIHLPVIRRVLWESCIIMSTLLFHRRIPFSHAANARATAFSTRS